MEKLDLYDINHKKTDQTMIRDQSQPKNLYRLAVGVAIFNSKSQMLIQKRTDDKKLFPSLWDVSAAGAVKSGESSQMGIQRELKEELGVSVDFSEIRPKVTTTFPTGFNDFYTLNLDLNISDLTLQKSEVVEVKWASQAEIKQMIFSGKFIPYFAEFIDLIFVLKDRKDLYYSEH